MPPASWRQKQKKPEPTTATPTLPPPIPPMPAAKWTRPKPARHESIYSQVINNHGCRTHLTEGSQPHPTLRSCDQPNHVREIDSSRRRNQPAKEGVLVRATARTKLLKEREEAEKSKTKPEQPLGGVVLANHLLLPGSSGGGGGVRIGEQIIKVGIKRGIEAAGLKVDSVQAKKPKLSANSSIAASDDTKDRTGLLYLPTELRIKIWNHVVILPKTFIWPASHKMDEYREQPDLAMTCKVIREEVLEIFYAENMFGVDVSPGAIDLRVPVVVSPKGKSKGAKKGVQAEEIKRGRSMFARWSSVLEEEGWFAKIRKWCFKFEPYQPDAFIKLVTDGIGQEHQNLLVSLTMKKQADGAWGADVEVHRDALCVTPGSERYGQCLVIASPEWLNDRVIGMLDAAKGDDISGKMIAALGEDVREGGERLAEFKCIDCGLFADVGDAVIENQAFPLMGDREPGVVRLRSISSGLLPEGDEADED